MRRTDGDDLLPASLSLLIILGAWLGSVALFSLAVEAGDGDFFGGALVVGLGGAWLIAGGGCILILCIESIITGRGRIVGLIILAAFSILLAAMLAR